MLGCNIAIAYIHAFTRGAGRTSRLRITRFCVCVAAVAVLPWRLDLAVAQNQKPAAIGRIEAISGTVQIERDTGSLTVTAALPSIDLHRGDRISTGASTRILIGLNDRSRLVLGELTSITLRALFTDSRTAASAMAIDLDGGILRLSAAPAERPHQRRSAIRTTAGTVNADQADLVARVTDDTLTVLLLSGRIEVRNSSGVVMLDKARHGIEKVESGQEPGHAYGWHRARIDQTLAELAMPRLQ